VTRVASVSPVCHTVLLDWIRFLTGLRRNTGRRTGHTPSPTSTSHQSTNYESRIRVTNHKSRFTGVLLRAVTEIRSTFLKSLPSAAIVSCAARRSSQRMIPHCSSPTRHEPIQGCLSRPPISGEYTRATSSPKMRPRRRQAQRPRKRRLHQPPPHIF